MKNISVFRSSQNPSIDPPAFHVSRPDAKSRVEAGYCLWLDNRSIQYWAGAQNRADEAFGTAAAGTMREAWQIRQSGYAGPLVLQQPLCSRLPAS